LLLVSYTISLSPLIIQGGSHVRCKFTSWYVQQAHFTVAARDYHHE
jgi:hypothetical protein